MHIRLVFAVVRQEAPIGEDKLKAVVEKSILVEGKNKPSKRLVLRLDLFQLRVYVAHATIVAEVFGD